MFWTLGKKYSGIGFGDHSYKAWTISLGSISLLIKGSHVISVISLPKTSTNFKWLPLIKIDIEF